MAATGGAAWAWAALAVTLAAVAGGHRRFELVALGSLLALGVTGAAGPPSRLFGGFGHPALITIASLMVAGQALAWSGMLAGLGRRLERRWSSPAGQMVGLALVTAGLSAFMSNVAALSLVLPTAGRMAGRRGVAAGQYGMPLAFAAILGGTLTLAGTAPNIIVSGYRAVVAGVPFRMFDFLPQGVAISLAALGVWWVGGWLGRRRPAEGGGEPRLGEGRRAGPLPGPGEMAPEEPEPGPPSDPAPEFAPLGTPTRRRCAAVLLVALGAVSLGVLAPPVAFGLAAVSLVLGGIVPAEVAYRALDLKVIVFLGSMLSLSDLLVATGALSGLVTGLEPVLAGLPRWWLLAAVFAAASLLSNMLNNAAAAVIMAPLALRLAALSGVAGPDAALMAVAAGSSLALLVPTNQVILMAMSQAPFGLRRMQAAGLAVTLASGAAAVGAISLLWP